MRHEYLVRHGPRMSKASERRTLWALAIAASTAVAAAFLIVSTSSRFAVPSSVPQQVTAVPVKDGQVALPIEKHHDEVSFFQAESNGERVRLFVVAGSDKPVVYRDACTRCADSKRGHRFERGRLICIQCEKEFPLNVDWRDSECTPVMVTSRLQGNRLTVLATDLLMSH